MTSFEVPREQWKPFFDDLSQQYRNWQTSIEVQRADLGDQFAAENAPLQGISFEPTGSEAGDIEIALGDTANSFQVHRIEKPEHVRVADTQPGKERDLQIESAEGTTVIVRVRPYPEITQSGQ